MVVKKTVLLSMLALSAISMSAREVPVDKDSIIKAKRILDESLMMPIKQTFLKDVTVGSGWNSNWFLEVKGGATAFLGSPVGCGDFFDRITPTLQIGLGKWFTPSIGGRVAYQGTQFKNANLQKMKYHFVHAELMYNITANLSQNEQGIARWDLVPFVGIGMIYNPDWQNTCRCSGVMSNNHPFAFSYGVQVGYRLTDRIHILGEISGMTTAKSFDGINASSRFGDNMLTVSAGLSVTIGKTGWKRVIDARPYIRQNNYLMDQCAILSRYALESASKQEKVSDSTIIRNKNSYRGLTSLRNRMALAELLARAAIADSIAKASAIDSMSTSKISIDTPVYFYFKRGSCRLVDATQLANLDELAHLATEQNLTVTIRGAADSATGSKSCNRKLSKKRARYIGRELLRRGVNRSQMHAYSLGGIEEFDEREANRFTLVILSRPESDMHLNDQTTNTPNN